MKERKRREHGTGRGADGRLYAAANEALDGFAVGVSGDDGETFAPVARFGEKRLVARCLGLFCCCSFCCCSFLTCGMLAAQLHKQTCWSCVQGGGWYSPMSVVQKHFEGR